MKIPDKLEKLIVTLARLPAVGRRSAERMAFRLVTRPKENLLQPLIEALQEVSRELGFCPICGGVTEHQGQPCAVCVDPERNNRLLCIVEDAADIFLFEKANCFSGKYHVLGGKISPRQGQGPSEIRVQELLRRVEKEKVEEVILALNADVESDATAAFLAQTLKGAGVELVSHLAWGIPAGGGVSYLDSVTLARAIGGRVRC